MIGTQARRVHNHLFRKIFQSDPFANKLTICCRPALMHTKVEGLDELVEDVSLGRAQARKLLGEGNRAKKIQSNTENAIENSVERKKSPDQASTNTTKSIVGPTLASCDHTAAEYPELPAVVRFPAQENSHHHDK